MNSKNDQQQSVCSRFGAVPCPCSSEQKVGISQNVREGNLPINGLRVKPAGDTTGWYIWAGEQCSDDPEFFVPLHVKHLNHWCPEVIPFLSLPIGWRFQIAPHYEDVWFDSEVASKERA